ncbi:MAG TPA: GNAT family N-acetyltransferase [Abditibacteriaceae bacterium]|jgi:ribosomal protein S18 acetylase RimI-like enzyme
MKIRPLTPNDEALLWPFLMLAAHEEDIDRVRENPQLARYVVGWGRSGDSGFVAFDEQNKAIGAVWLRLWPHSDKGFGWIADDVPELAMAIVSSRRGEGIGTRLLNEVLQTGRERHRAISLSVREDNAAMRLYRRVGFEKVPGSETTNRVGSLSFTMKCNLGRN